MFPICSYYVKLYATPRTTLLRRLGAPALMIGLARLRPVRRRPDHHVDLGLLVALAGVLFVAVVLLSPDQRQLGAGLGVLLLDEAEREHLALVPAVAGEHRGAGRRAAAHDRVERARCIVRERDVDVFVVLAGRREHRLHHAADVLIVPGEGHLLAMR